MIVVRSMWLFIVCLNPPPRLLPSKSYVYQCQSCDHDKTTVKNNLLPLGNSFPLSFKLVRIGKLRSDTNRSLKLICTNKEEAKSLIYQ